MTLFWWIALIIGSFVGAVAILCAIYVYLMMKV